MISLIIPVYNVARWLREALDSVEKQTFTDWEAILVDDGSTDDSGTICDKYASRNPHFRVIHTSNGGLSMARNTGIDAARGSEIAFMDSDDLIPPDYLEVMYETLDSVGGDIVCVPMHRFTTGCSESKNKPKPSYRKLSGAAALEEMLYQNGTLDSSACGKLFRKELWDKLRFTPGLTYEDLDLIYRLIPLSCRVVETHATCYWYRATPGSILHTISSRRGDVLDITARMVEFFKEVSPELTQAARARQLSANFNILGIAEAHPGPLDSRRQSCHKIISDYPLSEMIKGKLRRKDRLGLLLYRCLSPRIYKIAARRIYR